MDKGRSKKKKQSRSKTVGMPLEIFLRRQRVRRRAVFALAFLLLTGLVLADQSGLLFEHNRDMWRFDGRMARVVRVIDGDTIEIALPNEDDTAPVRVRLWGIDTPETNAGKEGVEPEPFAIEAKEATTRWCGGATVRLHLQSHQQRGRYGRLLAYIELPDGDILNERLLAAGLAGADDRFDHQHYERYLLIEKQAKYEKVGMWER